MTEKKKRWDKEGHEVIALAARQGPRTSTQERGGGVRRCVVDANTSQARQLCPTVLLATHCHAILHRNPKDVRQRVLTGVLSVATSML